MENYVILNSMISVYGPREKWEFPKQFQVNLCVGCCCELKEVFEKSKHEFSYIQRDSLDLYRNVYLYILRIAAIAIFLLQTYENKNKNTNN